MTEIFFIGVTMIVVTVVIESCVIAVAVAALDRTGAWLSRISLLPRTVVVLSTLSLWLLLGIGAALWVWATLFIWIDEFTTFASSMYFTSVTATTLGFGDSLLSERWHLLSGFLAANGLLLFSLNTAFLFEALRRIGESKQIDGRRSATIKPE